MSVVRTARALALWLIAATAFAQGTVEIRAGQPLGEALRELQSAGLDLLYSSELVRPEMSVRETPRATEPLAIAREILAPHGLRLGTGPGGRWLVQSVESAERTSTSELRGRILAADTGRPLSGVRVLGPDGWAVTDSDGRFELAMRLPATLQVRAAGYETAQVDAGTADPPLLELLLQPEPLQEVTVVASRYRLFGVHATAEFDHEEIDRVPHLADDLARAVRRLPAVATDDHSARFNLRGGRREETPLRLDGLALIDPFHLKDLQGGLSIVDSNLVDRVDVLPGGFPVEYGDAASGIVDIHTLGRPARPEHALGVSFVNAFANTRGSFADQRGGWLVSVRRGYLDWLFEIVNTGSGEFTPRYYDVLAKLEHDVGERHTLSMHVLAAQDDLLFTQESEGTHADGKADSLFTWSRLRSAWTEALKAETVLWRGAMDRIRDIVVDDRADMTADLLDRRDVETLGLRSDWRWQGGERWYGKWGLELQRHEVDYDYALQGFVDPDLYPGHAPLARSSRLRIDGEEFAVHAAAGVRLGERLHAELGLRWDRESYTGFGEDLASPRLNLRYELGPRTELRAAWGRFHQFQQPEGLQVEDDELSFFPATRTSQGILGLEHRFVAPELTLRIEAYEKRYARLQPRFANLLGYHVILEAAADRVRIDADTARTRGVELTLKRRGARGWSYWGSYTYAEAEDRIDARYVRREWDQRHAVNVVTNWRGERWNLNLAGAWHSGWPRTEFGLGTIDTPAGPQTGVVFGPRNAARHGDYLRFDTRLSRNVPLERGEFTYFLELYNIFNTQNPCCVDELDLHFGPLLVHDDEHWLPRMPSFGFTWTFR